MNENDSKKSETMNFEEGMSRLEEIVDAMERGELSLDESVKLFREGAALYKKLQEKLKSAEGEIKVILEESGGNFSTHPFEED